MIYFSKTFAIFLLVWSASAFLQAQTVSFQPLNGPHGVENVSNVASDNSGNLFMVTNRQILRSTDNGDSWAVCMDGIPTSSAYFKKFLLAPSGKFYAQFEYADLPLYCYQPAANSWAPVPLPADQHYADGFDFDHLGRMWASTNASFNKIHYSTDAGVSFHEIPLSAPVEGWFDFLATYNDAHNLIAVAYGANQKLDLF